MCPNAIGPTLPLPTFLMIGAQKSATRWLRFNLDQHPDIFTTPAELEFFNYQRNFNRLGTEWYRCQFEGWAGEAAVGESTPGYMMWRHDPAVVAERIERVVPGVRLIAILRNPVDRAQSALVHQVRRRRLPPDAHLIDVVRAHAPLDDDPWGIVSGGWYARSLEPFAQRFGDQLLVLLHDDISVDAPRVYESALHHLGVDTTFVPPELSGVRFSNKDLSILRRLVRVHDRKGPWKGREPSLSERQELFEHFRHDVRELEALIGRDLSCWEPSESG